MRINSKLARMLRTPGYFSISTRIFIYPDYGICTNTALGPAVLLKCPSNTVHGFHFMYLLLSRTKLEEKKTIFVTYDLEMTVAHLEVSSSDVRC